MRGSVQVVVEINFDKMKTIPIKNTIRLILLAVTLIACNSPVYISGKLEDIKKNNIKIYLIKPESLRDITASYLGKVIDSAIVNSDGSFEFRNPPKTKEPVLFELAIQQSGKAPNYLQTDDPISSNYMPVLWQPGETLQIAANVDNFQQSFSIEHPSEMNKTLLDLRYINEKAYQFFPAR